MATLPEQDHPVARHQIIRGSGQLISADAADSSAELPAALTATGDVTLNFAHAEIQDVAKAVLGNILKLNYIVDPGVRGAVTVQTSRPLSRAYVLPVLTSALQTVGVTIVHVNGEYRVVPMATASRQGEPLTLAGHGDPSAFHLEIVPLKYVGVADIEKVLNPLAPSGTIVQVDPERNLLVLGGTETELSSLLRTISIFDVDQLAGQSFGLFTLSYSDSKVVTEELRQILLAKGSSLSGLVRLQPVERLNAVLAVTPQPEYLTKIQSWISRLDQAGEAATRHLYVYYVQNGRAADLASVLRRALTNDQATTQAQSGLLPAANRTQVTYTPASGSGGLQGGAGIDQMSSGGVGSQPLTGIGGLSASPLSNQSPAASSQNDAWVTPGSGGQSSQTDAPDTSGADTAGKNGLRITADENNNALLISATPDEYNIVRSALQKLDVQPLQVLIEAAIVEVTLTKNLQYGVQYFLQSGNHSVILSAGASQAIAPTFPGFAYMFSAGKDIESILTLLKSISDIKVISAPQLAVLNNETARLQVGDEVPVATQQAVSVSSAGAPIVNSIQFADTGVILKVTPRVNASGMVLMDVSQEVSDVTQTTSSNLNSPTIQVRKINSSISVRSGETVALGGLIKDSTTRDRNGIPVLEDIPYLGNLFSSTAIAHNRTELIVLITPHVIRGPDDARDVTDELEKKVQMTLPLLQKVESVQPAKGAPANEM